MSTTLEHATWHEMNHAYITSELARVRATLERHVARVLDQVSELPAAPEPRSPEFRTAMAPPALASLCAAFGLSPFERDVLLLCAGLEFDAAFGPLCASAQGDPVREEPTFGLALAAFDSAHWSALTPASPLRYWRLVELVGNGSVTRSPLRIDERILHYLAGIQHLDERLSGIVEPLRAETELVPSHAVAAERLALIWETSNPTSPAPVVHLTGDEHAAKLAIVAAACERVELNVVQMDAAAAPVVPGELEGLIRIWGREAVLSNSALVLDCQHLDAADQARVAAIDHVQQWLNGPLVIFSRERMTFSGGSRSAATLEVGKPQTSEQRDIWQRMPGMPVSALNGQVDALVSQFNLNLETIKSVQVAAALQVEAGADGHDPHHLLWDACRVQTRARLSNLAQRVEPAAGWDDLVLPQTQLELLRNIAAHVRGRFTVYETWGFARKGTRGLGLSALFTGASGTGKTMAAEVLAGELRLDLYKIDLSQVVNKYIGETEKNLDRLFNAAEAGGAILFFDEADALFGKRSEVKDSHDRYANIEVSYLLQRMETYRGLAILATNLKNALDSAFLRRIRFVVQFPFPDVEQRAAIWRRTYPGETPTEGLDFDRLARLNITGGNIRNIALNAAFLAADAGQPVRMAHLLRAARTEYTKLDRQLTESEIGGWS